MRNSVFAVTLFVYGSIVSGAHAEKSVVVLTDGQLASLSAGVASAKTPEEAARLFAKLASAAIGQAVANTLAQAVGTASVSTQANGLLPVSRTLS